MTLYYKDRPFEDEMMEYLRKDFPRGVKGANSLEITRASTIDDELLLKYFDCAVAKEHNMYQVHISLPENLENRIPTWFVQSEDGEIWIDPNSGVRGKNIYREHAFVVKFHLYVNDLSVHSFDTTRNLSTQEAIAREFLRIKSELVKGNEEPIEVFKHFYQIGDEYAPKSQVAKYLNSILSGG